MSAQKIQERCQLAQRATEALQKTTFEVKNDLLLKQESEQNEHERFQQLEASTGPHQVINSPVYTISMFTNSANDYRYQAESYDEFEEKYEDSFKEGGD